MFLSELSHEEFEAIKSNAPQAMEDCGIVETELLNGLSSAAWVAFAPQCRTGLLCKFLGPRKVGAIHVTRLHTLNIGTFIEISDFGV